MKKRFLLFLGLIVLTAGLISCQAEKDNTAEDVPAERQQDIEPTNSTSEPTSDNASSDTQVIEVEAYQYGWNPNPIRVEAGRPVRLELTSRDVDHGISIPEFGVSQTIPDTGETVTAEFTPDETGTFSFTCNVYCGRGHGRMTGQIIVE